MFYPSSLSAPTLPTGYSPVIPDSTQSPVDMEEKLKELEDEIHLDIKDREDKVDENSLDDKKHLQAILKQIGESAAIKAKKSHELDNDYYEEIQ